MPSKDDSGAPVPIAYPVKVAVRVSGLSRSAIYEAIRAGELRSTKKGKRRIIFHTSLVEYLTKPEEPAVK
jgi:Helix-turn-helix domain